MKLTRPGLIRAVAGVAVLFGCVLMLWHGWHKHDAPLPARERETDAGTAPRSHERLRAAHYFADAYPVQFWHTFEPSDVAGDFARIKSDGFNAIVLILPWGDFQPSLSAGTFDERMFERLQFLMDEALKAGLGVVLRLSYYWSYRADVEKDLAARVQRLFYDDAARDVWLAHIAEIYRRIGTHAAFRLAFLSWEDLHPMHIATGSPQLDDQNILRMYRQYLARTNTLEEISVLYDRTFVSWEEVPFPGRRSPAYVKILDYWGDALLNLLFVPANRRFPNLSFEVRSDWDPVWGKDGAITWKNHASTYTLPGADTLTVYYSTSWGMKNEGNVVSAADTLKAFDRFTEHLDANKRRQHVFIDQFLFYYELEEFRNNTQIKPDERDQFLHEVAKRFRDRDIGYALWYYRDHIASDVYNAHFSLGVDGWQVSPEVRAIALANGHHALTLKKGDRISQTIRVRPRGLNKPGNTPLDICITREPGVPAAVTVAAGGTSITMDWSATEKRTCKKIQRANELNLSITSVSDMVMIDLVEVFSVLEPSAVYDRDLKPGPQLEAIRKLNALATGPVAGTR